jgi:hypothetical protein
LNTRWWRTLYIRDYRTLFPKSPKVISTRKGVSFLTFCVDHWLFSEIWLKLAYIFCYLAIASDFIRWRSLLLLAIVPENETAGAGGFEQLISREYTDTTFNVKLSPRRALRRVLLCLILFFTNPLMLIQSCIFWTVIWQVYVMTVSLVINFNSWLPTLTIKIYFLWNTGTKPSQ